MNRGKIRLAIAVCLFLAWLGYLVYLVAVTRDPVILSRPQFLVSNLYVLAELTADEEHPDTQAKVREVRWAADEGDKKLLGVALTIQKLDKCGEAQGWRGPGVYIVPLSKFRDGSYHLTETPPSPGFSPNSRPEYRYRIYSATEDSLRQLDQLVEAMKARS